MCNISVSSNISIDEEIIPLGTLFLSLVLFFMFNSFFHDYIFSTLIVLIILVHTENTFVNSRRH